MPSRLPQTHGNKTTRANTKHNNQRTDKGTETFNVSEFLYLQSDTGTDGHVAFLQHTHMDLTWRMCLYPTDFCKTKQKINGCYSMSQNYFLNAEMGAPIEL